MWPRSGPYRAYWKNPEINVIEPFFDSIVVEMQRQAGGNFATSL